MERITEKQLQNLVDRINTATGSPAKPWSRTDGRSIANVGCYHLDGAYGGWCLHRINNESGGVTTPIGGGYNTKRELDGKLQSYLSGLEFRTEQNSVRSRRGRTDINYGRLK
jgi:hypothetical protein